MVVRVFKLWHFAAPWLVQFDIRVCTVISLGATDSPIIQLCFVSPSTCPHGSPLSYRNGCIDDPGGLFTYEVYNMSSDSGSSISAGEDQQLAIYQRQQVLQAEQEGTQKRTFSNWINSQLLKHQKESVVKDLYADMQDGHVLLDLLEALSGEVLPREKVKNIFQSRSNIESALTFLGKQSIKLINIHVEDIISGKPSIVLGLIWQIILHFHIEGLASILAAPDDLQPVKCDSKKEVSPTASPSPKRSAKSRWKISAKKVLLQWAQEQCARMGPISVTDFKSSWKNGQAFLAIIHSLRPDLVDMEKFRVKSNEEKLREAFRIAEEELKIPRLLEPEDINVSDPDEKSIMTYVAQFLQYSKNRADPTKDSTDRVRKAMEWLNVEEQTLKKRFSDMKEETYTKKYQEILLFMRKFNEQKRIYMSDLAMENLQLEEQRLIKQSLENITFQIAEWKEQLDHSLPPPLDTMESWLSEVENLMSHTLPESGSHHNAMSLLQTLSVSFKALMIHAVSHSESLRSFKNVDDNGVILVPADKMEEMKTRMEKILTAKFSVLVDYRFSGHYVLALLEEGRPKLKAWKGKYRSQEAVESLLANYDEFVGEKQSMVHLETAFHKFKELHNQLLTTEEYSDDPEIAKQYRAIELKYETFVSSTLEAKSVLEKVVPCWIQFENNIGLMTAWLDEQHKIHPGHVPMEILSKWKSVHRSLNREGDFLIERTNEKAASKLSHRLKSLTNRWDKYVCRKIIIISLKLYERQRKVGNGSEVQEKLSVDTRKGASARQTEVSATTLRSYIQTLQTGTKTVEPVQSCIDVLSLLEKLEKLTESVNVWAEGAEQVLTIAHPQEPLEESVIGNIQDFYENGISHQEQLAETERTVQAVAHLILSHKDLQHFSVDSLKRNIVQAHEKVQDLVSRLGFALHPPEKPLPEKDIKMNFERSKRDLEAYITSAVTLLGQKVTPEEFISQYEKTVGKFSIQNLDKFLNAADQMKTISTDKEKLTVDEVSADLRHRWKAVRYELETYISELKKLIQKPSFDEESCKLKTQISKVVHQNGGSIPEDTEMKGSNLDGELQIYEAQKRDLELLLQRSREKLSAESPREVQDVNELQSRCQELQDLQAQLNKSWRRLESTSHAVEKLMEGDEKSKCSETQSALQSNMEEVIKEFYTRIQSLSMTIDVLLPIEQEVSVLCESNLQTPAQEMEKFTVSGIGSMYQVLQEFQSSVEDQIQQCDYLESATEVVDPASPVDAQAFQSAVQQYKVQLEAKCESMKEREDVLKDLESFLSSLATTKWSIQAVTAVSDKERTTILQKQKNIELLEKKVHKLRMEAKELDVQLVPAQIYLEDPEHGGETSCQKLIDGFFEKIEIAKQAILQELSNLDTQDSGIPSLNGALNRHLPSDDDVASGLNDYQMEQKMETFTVSKIDSVLQKMKEVQNTFESEIHQCDSLDPSVTEPTLNQYKMELQATNQVMKERETTLKTLGDFLSSLKAAKASIETKPTIMVMDNETLLQKQRNLEELERDIYRLGQEAEKLDDKLQSADITLEEPDFGGVTSCQKMISVFFDKLENAQQAVLRELQNLQEREALEALNNRQRTLCKHIEDIQDQIDQIGLRDPTIHAVQQRMKSLKQVEKNLESFTNEKISISNGFLELLQTTRSKDICGLEEFEMLWDDAVQNITHSKEQCEVVIELLRKFQNYKKELTLLIQKAEMLMTCQASYIGKENLQKSLKKLKSVKQEFDDHSEDVEEINSICKKLQFQINQIKSFEESPFQTEAHTIIDKWLDITEKLESYNENLKSAISLWSKILHFSEDIEQWSELRKNVFETSDLTREDVLQLNIEAKNYEQHLEEITKLSREIQNLLQTHELPLELQVIQTSLQNKIIPLSKFASAKVNILEKSPITPVLSPFATSSTDGELVHISSPPTADPFQCVNGGAETERRHKKRMDGTQQSNRQGGSTTFPSEPQRIEFQIEVRPNLPVVKESEQLRTLHVRLSELKQRRENLNTELQPGQQEKIRQLASFTLLLQEGQALAGSLEELNAEMMAAGYDGSSQGQDNQWLEIAQLHDSFMRELQDTVQTLESRIEGQRHYDSLFSALNNKMTSFYEELLNFSSSSRESAPCEQKRQKLQELRGQYEVLQKDLSEVSQVAEGVKQSTSSPGVKRIQEALEMNHSGPSKGAMEDKIKARETSAQDENNRTRHVVVENVSHNVLVTAVEGPVELAAQKAVESAVKEALDRATKEALDRATKEALDRATKEALDRATKEALDRATKEALDRATKEALDRATKEALDRATKEALDRATKEALDRATKEALDRATKEALDRATKEALDRATKEALDRATKEALDRATKEALDRATKEALDRATKEALDRATKEALDRATKDALDRATKETPDRATKETPDRVTKEAPDRDLKVSIFPDKPSSDPTDQPPVQPGKSENVVAASYTADKQIVNGVTSPVQKTSSADQEVHAEFVQKKINQDASDSLREVAKVKALEECVKVTEEQQEAIGQLQMRLDDCDSFRRQLETALSNSPADGNDLLRVSALLTTVEEKLHQAEMLSDDGGRVVILNEAQPLYDEIKSYMEGLSKVAAKIPSTFKKEEKALGAHFEDAVGVNTQETQLVIEQLKPPTGRDVKEAESALEEPYYARFQQQMQEILTNISLIGGDQAEKTLEKFASHIKLLCVREDDKIESERSPEGLYIAKWEEEIKSFQKHPLILSVTELEQYIEGIEKLYNEISQIRSQEPAVQETRDGDSRGSELLLSKCEDLLNELTTFRTEKKILCQALKSFQGALSAARESYQMLCKEKENLKMIPTESLISQLDKIKQFRDQVEKEKVNLHILKAEQCNIDHLGISSKGKDIMDNEVSQIEDLWEQMEFSTHRECDRLTKEAEELAAFKDRVDDVRSIIQVQQDLLDQPSPSSEDVVNASLGLFADIQAIKHWFNMSRNTCDLQMKRTWSGNERQDLENSLDNLQSELENLEERVKDRQLTRCQTPDAFLEQYPSLKPLYSSLLWVKKSQDKSNAEKGIALLLGDIERQTTTYKKAHKEIVDRNSATDSAIGESKHISVSFDGAMSKDFSSFLQQLQELYRDQIIQSTSRLQQLEIGWEKRKALFSEIEKLKELLQCLEKEATPVKRGIFTATELCEQLNCLKAKTTEMEEIEGLVLTLLRNSQIYHSELKSSEQLYLNDILRSLKSKARRIRRLEENTFCYTKKLLSICNEFQKRLTSLHQNLNASQPIELKMCEEASELDGEVSEKKLQLSQNAVSSSEDHLPQILRYKDLFKDNRLHWDGLTIDDLQKNCLSFTERSGHSEHCGPEQGHYQELLKKIRTMVCSLQKESVPIAANFDVIAAQVSCKKIKKIRDLFAEAVGWLHSEQTISVDSIRAEEQSLTALAENMERSYQALSQLVTDYYERQKHSPHQVKQAVRTLNRIDQELQESFVNELDENKLQERLLRLEALGDISKAEVQGLSSVSSRPSDLREHLQEVKNTGQQIEKKLSEHIVVTNETYNILQNMQKAITKVAELFRQYEEKLHKHHFALSSSDEKTKTLDCKEVELNVAIAKIQNIADQLKSVCSTENQRDLDDILSQICNKNYELAGIRERKQSILASYEEKYQIFKNKKQKILKGLEEMEVVIGDSFLQKPASYKAALEQWEKSKNLMAKIQSYEEELQELQWISRGLSASNDDYAELLEKMVSSLWDRWLYVLGIARNLELYCDELKQEWKFISELLEREVILLDNCQEEVLDRPEVRQRTPHLQNSFAEIERFEENVHMQQLQLSLLKHRIWNILGTPEMGSELVPVIKEIQVMQAKCEGLLHKAQVNKQEIEAELQERETLKDKISAVNKSVREVSSSLENMEITDVVDRKASLEELLKLVGSEKENTLFNMEKLQDQYTETVPEELQLYAEQCQENLRETEEKIKNEIEQCSPQNILTRKANEITAELKSIEAQLAVKTENIFQAKEIQKKVWDEVDSWHSKLHALESEVQDMAEEDPSLAHEWMDKLTEPLNCYQRVTYLAERRTTNINKAASKLEEYEDTFKSTKLWIQNTDGLLNEEMKDCSAKILNKHVNALAIALDDSDGKHQLLHNISSELGELAVICNTDKIVETLGEVRSQVKDLQQRILKVLLQIQHLANEVGSIEDEVKRMEKRLGSIRTILTSNDIDDMSPMDHHKNGQVILENIDSIRGTVAEIEAYRPALPLTASGVHSLCVFRRMGRLLREAEVLEKVTKEQKKLLKPIIGKMLELEQEQENLKHISKNFTYETPDIKNRTEELRKRMDGLNLKKEAVLLSQRNSVIQQLVHLQQEPEDRDLQALLSPVTEGVDSMGNEMRWNDPFSLPSLVEETEESSLTTEAAEEVTVDSEAVDLDVNAKEDASDFFISPIPSDQMTQEQLKNAATTLGSVKPEMILRDCQGKVTEVELWLERVNLSLAESKQEPDMRQSLEQKLIDFQKTLQETEKKINRLLEGADANKQGPSSLLEDAESLSIKLKALKVSLENLQAMLQVRPDAEQVKSTDPADKKHPTEKMVPSQEIVNTLQTRSAAGEVVSGQTRPRGKSSLPEDITWSKWQYLQKELSHRTKAAPLTSTNEPETEKEVRINFISRFPGRAIKPVLPEDSKQFLTRLQALGEEAAAPLPQESGINLHSTLFVWLCSVSQWLQKVEEMLDTDLSREEASLELAHYEKLSEDLNSLSEEMRKKMDSLLKQTSHAGEHVGILSQCYNDISNWLVQTHGAVLSRTKNMREELKKHNNYQNDVRQVYDIVVRRKSVLQQQLGNRSGCEAEEYLKESAVYETELQNFESQVSVLTENGEKISIPVSSNQEIHKLQDVLDETWSLLKVKQDEHSGTAIAKSQVDSVLCGVTDLLSYGKEKILNSNDYKCASKEALNSHIQENKNFFNILDSQVLLLQALSSKNCTPTNCKQIAETAVHEADILSKEADAHCIHMMAIMKEWDDFDSRYNYFSKKMEALESLVPTKSLVEESEERVKERLLQYQQIKVLLDENEPRLNWVVVPGKRLQPLLRCRDLDSQVLGMEQQWSQLTQKVGHELHRLESLGSHLASYNRDSAELSAWLSSAYQKLNNCRTQSLDVSQDLDTIKDNLHKFFEFTFEVDEKSSLKTSVLNRGTQLLRLKEADPAMLKLTLAKYEEQWAEIIAELPPIQDKLQQLLIEKLPSLQEIQELMDWMKIFEQSAETVPTITSDIRSLLQKYKTLQKEMSHKQCVVDFVNQSLLQLSVGDVEAKRYKRTELAELLGTLNLQWNNMKGDLNRKIQHVEQTLESISDQESRRQSVNNWFDAQQVRLNKLQRSSSLTAAESILAECSDLEEQIKAKSNVLEELERSAPPAGENRVFQEGVLTSENLLKKRDALSSQVADMKTSIHSLLRHWKTYNENHEYIKKMLVKLLYKLGQAKRPISSLDCLKHHLKILQSAQEETEQHEKNWSKIRAALKNMEGLCSPSGFAILEQDCKEVENRWTSLNEELSSHLQSAGLLLQLWEAYSDSYQNHTLDMEQLEGKCQQLLYSKLSEDRQADSLQQRIQDLQVLEQSLQALRAHNLQVSELADKVIRQNAAAADVVHSERQNTSHRIDHLERSVLSKTAEMKLIQNEVEVFKNDLEKLQLCVKSSADFVGHVCLSQTEKEERSELIKKHLLELRELSADIERLNEESFTLPLDDRSLMSLQNLNRSWEKTGEMALEDCREHRVRELDRNTFIQNYETWMQCVEKMENNLTVGIAGTFEALKIQQAMYEKMQAEIAINEQILPSFVNKALSVLESEEEQNRSVILKLTSLKEKWQSVIGLVQQRNREITVLLKQWWQFRAAKQRLGKNLSGVQAALSSVSPQKCHSLINAEKLLYDFKEKERHLERLQPIYNTMVENGKDLLAVAEPETKEALQCDMTQLQDLWQNTTLQLQAVLTHFRDTALKRKHFERKVEERRKSLHGLKARVDEPLPTIHEDLQRFRLTLKELEEALDEWGDSLKELDNMKAELSQYIIAEDGVVLKKQVEALHRQWEELCLRVSMRKQEIEDRLNAWNVFNEKNKELCDWLTQMESKVLQNADVNIEEMIEKLQKDCMEEINLFSENKLHLKQIGEQLIIASNKARSTEIENKLNKVNDRWKHLFDVIGSRVKNLKETLVIIQQLDKKMSNLRTWLGRIESELSTPLIYSICDDQEINKKLEEQKDLQKDIELNSAGVASVLNICERLLHDTDACANETECDSIQQTTRSLDKRWRNICTMSMERRLRIEETWRLWQKFLEDYSKFDDWLKEAEAMAASPDSSDVLYTKAKEEQKKFEAFQRQIHERLTHLELINKQYRRLARENRTDAASRLKQMVHEGNQRWDQLQRRVASILRRLKHFTSQREDFEGTRDCILVWLTQMDIQLTNVEHFSESDIEEKMQQLIGFKQEITLNTNKIDQLIVFGEQLIQKSEAMDAVVIEDELEEIHRYCQEVFGRVYRFHERLTSKGLNLEEEREASGNDTDGEDSREIQNSSWHATIPEVDNCHLMPPHERSGRETPVSVDSIPLEWDPTVDVGGSSMHENEEESGYYNPLSDVEIAESPEAYVIMTTKTVQASSGKSDLETPSWHSPAKHMAALKPEYKQNEAAQDLMLATTKALLDMSTNEQTSTSTPSRETDVRTSGITNEQLDDNGLRGIYSPETQSGVIERWEIIQAQSLSNELRSKQNLQQWQQLNSDLDNISLWLGKTEAELDNAENLKPSTSLQELEQKVKRFKDTLKAFDNYKALVLSANLSSKEFQQADDAESGSLLSRLHEVNSRWDQACHKRDKWRKSLQNDLNQCEEFHETSHQLLLWLTEAESRRLKYQVAGHKGDLHALLECQRQLMQLKEQLLERRIQANSLQDMSSYLLGSNAGGGYVEADERTHVIATKMRQLLQEVSRDLKIAQRALDDCTSDEVDSVTAADSQVAAGAPQDTRTQEEPASTVQEAPKTRSFFYRVFRAALPLQLLLLLLLLLACMIPFSEDDYSCAQANNFARSFYPMLRYTNGPPPT
ncbi:PREDICTED: nesprin-2 [Nanorana parkeri]|uniref:nesprin-2 n=1 Tax=Nanorana parkeri TaxID=125878 RepID=UPI0008544024|nr:PREDICTED: nesprin-2 [Nanorana parkeri]